MPKPATKGKRGGQPGNQNARKLGIYAKVRFDTLDEEERLMVENRPDDILQNLSHMVDLLEVKERRLMKLIARIEQESTDTRGLIIESVNRQENRREFDSAEDKDRYNEIQRERIAEGKKLPGRDVTISTTSGNSANILMRAHTELTKTTAEKRQVLAQLLNAREAIERLELDRRRADNKDRLLALEEAKFEFCKQRALGIIDFDELISASIEIDE